MHDWQSWTALAIVVLTIVAFIFRAKRRAKKEARGCGDCGSGKFS